jgi:hypothetical protein
MPVYRNMVRLMALTMIVLGVAMIVVTVVRAGFGVGVVLGTLFIAAGGGRFWMLRGRAR